MYLAIASMQGRMIIATSMIARPCMTVCVGVAAARVETVKLEIPYLGAVRDGHAQKTLLAAFLTWKDAQCHRKPYKLQP
jgi:hypothetical protein